MKPGELASAVAPSGKPPEAAAAGVPGAPPSNTAPGSSNTSPPARTRIVAAGIDSLYLSVRGTLKPGAETLLRRLKEQAQSPDPELRALAQFPGHDWIFEVSDKGARRFSYVLTDQRYRIELAKSTSKALPMAHVQISSAALAAYGVTRAIGDLIVVLSELGDVSGEPQVSRVDLYVDAVTTCDLGRIEDEQWVTRAQSKARYSDQGRRSGHVIGGGGNVSLRLYDKTLEIRKSGKDHATRRWRELGWNGLDTVWRVEAQVRRAALAEFGIRTVPELLAGARALWRYVTGDWCRLATPNWNDCTPSRWPTHPFWEAIGEASDYQGVPTLPRRVLRRSKAPADWVTARQFLGALTTFMAVYEIFDSGWALEDLVAMVKASYEVREEFTGITLALDIGRAVARKTRAYNIGAAFRVPNEIPLKLLGPPRQRGMDYDDDEK
jgi:hypothetical protein